MKFTRRTGVEDGRAYSTYREMTREDFQRFCAYCFRHEGELGGPGHFDQDHFEPKSVNGGAKERVFLNLYWCCKDCNSRQNKGFNWPTAAEVSRGECFCDSCDHDPEGVDYGREPDFSLRPLTASGRYTIRILRLNDRPELQVLFRDRDHVRRSYQQMLNLLRCLIERAEQNEKLTSDSTLGHAIEAIRSVIREYESFVNADPFVLTSVPEPVDEGVIAKLL